MVSIGQMVGMISAILLPVLVAVAAYIIISKHSKKIETGMPGALGYGILGYFWQELIYILGYVAIVIALNQVAWFKTDFGTFVLEVMLSVMMAALMTGGLYWGLYLTNDKQRSLYRSTTIGVGFGICYIGWNYLATYGIPIRSAFQMKLGSFTGDEALKAKVLSLSTYNMYVFAIKCILMFMIFTGIALLMGYFYLNGHRVKACLVPFIVQVAISLLYTVLPLFLPSVAATVVFYVLLAAMGLGAARLLFGFLRTGKVV